MSADRSAEVVDFLTVRDSLSRVRKSSESPETAASDATPPEGDVTLLSNRVDGCHVTEKTPPAAPAQAIVQGVDLDIERRRLECITDCATMTRMALRTKYRREADAHRNMLSRATKRGDVVDPEFHDFASFLKWVGPVPTATATLDRIDNPLKAYGPGLTRWVDAYVQNNNKGDTRTFTCSRTGRIYTSSQLARLQGVTPNTIIQRDRRGWSAAEIIAGTRDPAAATASTQVDGVLVQPVAPRAYWPPVNLGAADLQCEWRKHRGRLALFIPWHGSPRYHRAEAYYKEHRLNAEEERLPFAIRRGREFVATLQARKDDATSPDEVGRIQDELIFQHDRLVDWEAALAEWRRIDNDLIRAMRARNRARIHDFEE